MIWLRQTIAVMWINVQTIPSRLGSSIVAIIGIAGVVIVFVSVLSISSGFSSAMTGTGSPDRALILRKGVDTEMTSGLEGTEVRVIREAPGIRYDGDVPLVSAELSVVIDLPKKSKPDWTANVPMRGIQPETPKVRSEMKIIEGRMLRFGTDEAIVGKGAKSQFVGLNVGDTIVSAQLSSARRKTKLSEQIYHRRRAGQPAGDTWAGREDRHPDQRQDRHGAPAGQRAHRRAARKGIVLRRQQHVSQLGARCRELIVHLRAASIAFLDHVPSSLVSLRSMISRSASRSLVHSSRSRSNTRAICCRSRRATSPVAIAIARKKSASPAITM